MATTWYAVGTGGGNNLLKSTDDGQTWTVAAGTTNPLGGDAAPFGFRTYPDGTYLLAGRVGATIYVYKSTNAGMTWTTLQTITFGNAFGKTVYSCYLADDIQLVQTDDGTSNQYVLSSTNKFTSYTQSINLSSFAGIARIFGGTFGAPSVGTGVWFSDDGVAWSLYSPPNPWLANGGNAGYNGQFLMNASNMTGWYIAGGPAFSQLLTVVHQTTYGLLSGSLGTSISRTIPESFPESGPMLFLSWDGTGNAHTITTSDGVSFTHQSAVGLGSGPGAAYTVRLQDTGTYLVIGAGAGAQTWRSTDGINFSPVTNMTGQRISAISSQLSALIPATPTFPQHPDRGVLIEIAGPRNDQTRLNYLPIVRIYNT